jgi:enterochelin esterase-like enzyme
MLKEMKGEVITEEHRLNSVFLEREVTVEFFFPVKVESLAEISLLLINDGQDLIKMQSPQKRKKGFRYILEELYEGNEITPLFCIGIHAGKNRKNEYGTSEILDYNGRGSKAGAYSRFIFEELLPYTRETFKLFSFKEKSFCGFSLGGLSAFDIVWSNATEFRKAGLFSASLWWRTVDQDDPNFDESIHRIIHSKVRNGEYYPWLKFFFETGTLDETADRNNNGIIDSIDDTLSLIEELVAKGYDEGKDIKYVELADGRHDVDTWARAFPEFLKWGWGRGGIINKE